MTKISDQPLFTKMEMAGVCPVCSELSRSLKKFEKQLSEERKWNISQREYCIQLQQEMQKDKDLWQRQENKLRENIKDLSNKIEEFYKTIQDQHKENAHLEYKNEVLEDHKQELQDKVTMLQDKVKHLCAEMSTVQYRARMLEEKLTATTKLLEESHKLKARISQAEGKKSRLEIKANRLQEEKKQMQAELNHMRDENCQMQMQLIELQQNLSCLDAQQLQANHALQEKPDSLLDVGHLRNTNRACRENNDFADDCAAVNEFQVLTKEMENKDRNATFQNSCTLKWQQQTACCNSDGAAIHQGNECRLTPMEVADNYTECFDLDHHLIEDCVEENEIKRACSRNKDNQKTMFLDEHTVVYDVSGLDSSHFSAVSENVANLRETSSIGYTLKYGDENDTELPVSVSAVNVIHVTFAEKTDNFNAIHLKEASLHKNVSCMSSGKDDFVNLYSIEPESFVASDNEVNTLHAPSHEQAEDIRNGTVCSCYYEGNQTNVESPQRLLFYGTSMSQPVECYNEISGETEDNKDKYAGNFTHYTKECKNMQHSTEIISNGSANNDIITISITNFAPETKEDNYADNSPSHAEYLPQNTKNIETKKESITTETTTSISEANQIDNPDSVKNLGRKPLEGSSSIVSKKMDNRTENPLVNKKIKPQHNKSNQTKSETKSNEVSKKGSSNLEISSQSSSIENNEGSSNLEKTSQRASPGNNEGSSNSERKPRRTSPKNNNSSLNSENSSQRSSPRNNKGSSNSERKPQRTSPKNNKGSLNSEKSSQSSSPGNNEGSSNLEKISQRTSPKNNKGSSNSEKSSQSSSPGNNEGSSNFEKISQMVSSRNIEGHSNLDKRSQRASPKNNEGNLNSEKSSQRASPRSNGLNKNKEKLSELNKNCKCVNNTPSESLNNNSNNNANHLINKTNMNVCSRNIQTENQILNDNTSLQCETRNEGHMNSEETLGTMHTGAYRSYKVRGKLHASNKNNNNITKQRNVSLCNKNIQTENGIKHISLNKTAIDDSSVNKQNTGHYSKDVVKYVTLNKNSNSTDDTMVHKKTTSLYNRGFQSNVGIPSNILNNNNVNDVNFIHKRTISKYDENIQTPNGILSIALSKNKNTVDGSTVCRKSTSQNKDAHNEKGITLCKSADGRLRYKNDVLQCNNEVQIENGIQSSTSNKNNNSYWMHKNVSQTVNEIPSIMLSKRNSSEEDDLGQKSNISQCSKSIQTLNRAQTIATSKNSITDGNLTHKKVEQHQQNTQIENTNQFTNLSKNDIFTDDKVEYKNNSVQCNKDIQSTALSEHISTDDNLPHKKNMTQANKKICSENEIQYTSLGNKSDIVDDKLSYKMNVLQQSISSSNKNNTVNDNLGQKKYVSESNEHTKHENVIQSNASNRHDTTRDYHHQCRKNITQWNKGVQSTQAFHPIALNKSTIDSYFPYRRNTLKCEKCEETKSRITANKTNDFVTDNNLTYKCNIPKSNFCVQNQNEIKLISLNENTNENKHNVDNDLVCKNNTLHCSKDHRNHPSEPELEVLHKAENTCTINCNTSSNEICNDTFNSKIKATKILMQINSLSSSEEMSLVSAVKEGKFSNVEELLSLGTSPNCICNGNTALHAAAETGNLCMCRLLLEAGARADARDSFSGTPLHAAAKYGNLEVGKLLVKWGASIELRDKVGNLASDIAVNNGHLHMYNWLQQQICFQEQ